MAIAEARREDFSLETYRHLESRLNEIRRRVMDLAADAAKADDPTPDDPRPDVYSVKQAHVDAALKNVLGDSKAVLRLVGIEE